MDQVALRADIGPFVAEWLTALTSSTPTDGVQVGRPYGCFAIEKGPRLVFGDFWRAPVLTGTRYQAMADVQDEGDTYVIVGIGAAEVADLLGEREKLSALSSALDQERAGPLEPMDDGDVALLAFEIGGPTYPSNIRAQQLSADSSLFAGLDAGVDGISDASLAEINEALPWCR